jgi:hypothetical protein
MFGQEERTEAWERAGVLFSNILKAPCKDGAMAMQREYERSKRWMFPFFDSNGRIRVSVDAPNSADIYTSVVHHLEENCRLLGFRTERFAHFYQVDSGSAMSIMLRTLLLRRTYVSYNGATHAVQFSTEELFTGKLEKDMLGFQQGTRISRVLRLAWTNPEFSEYINQIRVAKRTYFGTTDISKEQESLGWDFINTVLGQVLSAIKISEKIDIVLSINPVDMLMASNHTTNWRSCHNIIDGEYATGPLSYALDEVTCIAYATRGAEYCDLLKEDWDRKLWRQMIFLDKNNLSAILSRHYPQKNEVFEKETRRLVAQVLSEYGDVEYKWKYLNMTSGCSMSADEESDTGHRGNNVYVRGEWMYSGDAFYGRIKMSEGGEDPDIVVGVEEMVCARCGEYRSDDDYYNDPRCEIACCGGRWTYCKHCEERLRDGDCIRTHCGDPICEGCYDHYYETCSDCNEIYHHEDTHFVDGEVVCFYCIQSETYSECWQCGDMHFTENMIYVDVKGYFCEHCADHYVDTCNTCGTVGHEEDMYYMHEGGVYCEDCVAGCDKCGEIRPLHELTGNMCKDCVEERIAQGMEVEAI